MSSPAVQPISSKPGGQIRLSGLLITLVVFLVVAAVSGLLFFLSTKLMYLICISALVAGFIVAAIVRSIMHSLRIRSTPVGLMLGIAAGIMFYCVYRGAEYIEFRQQVAAEIEQEFGQVAPGDVDEYIEILLLNETSQSGLVGYLLLAAQSGMTVTPRRGMAVEWSAEVTALYQVVEAAGLIGIIALAAMPDKRTPFCEDTGDWLAFESIGVVSADDAVVFRQLLRDQRFADAGKLVHDEPERDFGELNILVGRCHERSPEATIRVDQIQRNEQPQLFFYRPVAAEQYNAFLKEAFEGDEPDETPTN